MASQSISNLLGHLQQDPDDEQTLAELSGFVVNDSSDALDDEATQLLESTQKQLREQRAYLAVAKILEVQVASSEGDDETCSAFLKALGDVYRDELLDDEKARDAYARALELRPEDEDLQEQLEGLAQTAARWREFVDRFVEEAEASNESQTKVHLLVSAATLVWKYGSDAREEEVDKLFAAALDIERPDPRASRLYARVLRLQEKYGEASELWMRAAEVASDDKASQVSFFVRAARLAGKQDEGADRMIACYERALEVDPENEGVLTALVGAFHQAQQWDRLVPLFERKLNSGVTGVEEQSVLMQLGMIHWRDRESADDALPYFERLRELEPTHPAVLRYFRETTGEPEDMEAEIETLKASLRGTKEREKKLGLSVEIAELLTTQDDETDAAIDAWKAVLRFDAKHPRALEALRQLYTKAEKWNALIDVMKSTLDHCAKDDVEGRAQILRDMVPIYRDRLALDAMVINTYTALLRMVPDDEDAIDALTLAYEHAGRWNDLVQVLEKKAARTNDGADKVALLMRIASLWIERFANFNKATKPLEQVIEIDADHRDALNTLIDIYRKKRAWKKLYAVLTREAALASDPEARLALKTELATMAGKRLKKPEDAITLWKEILDVDPDRSDAVEALRKLAERHKDWVTLAEVLELQVAGTEADKPKIKLLQKLGTLYAEHLDAPAKSGGSWKRILDIDPKNGRAVRALRETFTRSGDWDGLEALYAETQDWEGLVDVLGHAAERVEDNATKLRLSFRAAEIYENELERPHRAFRSYERVLSVDEQNERAARALIPIYEHDEKWNRLPGLYEVLFGHLGEGQDAEKLELLSTLRGLAAERLRHDGDAFDYAGRAFEIAPGDPEIRDALENAAERAKKEKALAALFEKRLQALDPETNDEERHWLLRRIALLAQDVLDDPTLAISKWSDVLALDPTDEDAADALETLYGSTEQYEALRGLLNTRVEYAEGDDTRLAVLLRLAALEGSELGDAEASASRYRAVLEIEPSHTEALGALDCLALGAERWEELRDILERRIVLEDDEAARRALQIRLGDALVDHVKDALAARDVFVDVLQDDATHAQAIAGLERVAECDASLADEVGVTLEDAYQAVGAWDKLGMVLAARLESLEDPMDRRTLSLRYAELRGAYLGDPRGAYQTLERAFREAPTDAELCDRLVEAADAADEYESLAKAFMDVLEGDVLGSDDQAELAAKIGHLYDVMLARPEEAEPFHRKVLVHDPSNATSFTALRELVTTQERWSDLLALYRGRTDHVYDPEAKRDLYLQIAFLCEELIESIDDAIAAYREILELDPTHEPSRRSLERLFERTERWSDLIDLLNVELEDLAPEEAVGLTQRIGLLYEEKLGELGVAVDHFERVLELEGNHRHAREALERLLDTAKDDRQRIARILEPVYEKRGDWSELVSVLRVQLEAAETSGEHVDLLRRVADLQEHRLHDPSLAFPTLAKALAHDPADVEMRRDFERLALMRDAQAERAEVLEELIAASTDAPELCIELLLETAKLWDDQVGDLEKAEKLYLRLIAVAEDDAEVMLDASRALERIHLGNEDHAGLAEDLRRQVRYEDDSELRGTLLLRLADLLEEVLSDTPGAIAAHRERLENDPAEEHAMLALERLYESRAEWEALIEILERRGEVVTDTDEQRAIAFRIATILEHKVKSEERAIDAYNGVLSSFGQEQESLVALAGLYREAARWQDLLDVQEMRVELIEDVNERAGLRHDAAELLRLHLNEIERSVEVYREVLELVPDHEPTLVSLAKTMRADGQLSDEVQSVSPASVDPAAGDDVDVSEGDATEAADGVPEGETRRGVDEGDEATSEESLAGAVLAYPLTVRIEAARSLSVRYEATMAHAALLEALEVMSQSEDPLESFSALRRATEVAEYGLGDMALSFQYMGRAIQAGLGEDDLGTLLRDYRRLAGAAKAWQAYVALLDSVAPEIVDGDLQTETYESVAEVARDELGEAAFSRRVYEKILENQPDHHAALDSLESLVEVAGDFPALLDVLRRKTEIADDASERADLFLRRALLCEEQLEDVPTAIDCFDAALAEEQRSAAYLGLERLYRKAERYDELASHYERMLSDAQGDPVQIRHKLGLLYLDQLSDAWQAIEFLREVIVQDAGHEPSISALERLMENEEVRASVAEILEPVFLQSMQWSKVAGCLEARLEAEHDTDARKELLTRLGQLHEDYLEDLEGGFRAYARLVKEDPRDESSWETLGRLGRVLEAWSKLGAIKEEVLEELGVDDAVTLQLAVQAGELFDVKLNDLAQAAKFYSMALAFEPSEHGTFAALESVYLRQEAWEPLLTLYQEQGEMSESEDARVALLRKRAQLLEEKLGRHEDAIEAYRELLGERHDDLNAIDALDHLLTQTAQWDDLSDHVRHQIDLTDGGADALDLKHRLAMIMTEKLDDMVAALDLFEEITQQDPQHASTVTTLEQSIQNAEHQVRIIEILEPVYEATDQWRKNVAIQEALVERTEEPEERCRLLRLIAEIHEERGGDYQLAFHAFSRALSIQPDDEEVREQLARMTAVLGTWSGLVDAYEDAMKQTEDSDVIASLLLLTARVHQDQRDDARAAIATYERLVQQDAEHEEALHALDGLYTAVEDWPGLVSALKGKVACTFDPEQRGELLRRTGQVLEELVQDAPAAIEAFRSALDENEDDAVALESLDRLYVAAEAHEALSEILQRRIEAADMPEDRMALGLRLAAVYEAHLERFDDAIDALQRVCDDDASQPAAVTQLAQLFERQERWDELLENQRMQASTAEDDDARVGFLSKAASILETKLDDKHEALPTYEEVLRIDPGHDASMQALYRLAKDEEHLAAAAEVLEPLWEVQERWDDFVALLELKATAAMDPEEKRHEWRRIAQIHEAGRHDSAAAFQAFQRALEEDPADVASADDIERLAEAMESWEKAADIFAMRATGADDADAKRELFVRLARISEVHLTNDERAIEAFTRVLEESVDDEHALMSLDRLYTKTEAWEALADILERRYEATMDDVERTEFLVRLGSTRRDRLSDLQGAFRAFREVVESTPDDERAIAALEGLLSDEFLAPEVVELLDGVFRQTGRMDKVADIMSVRVRLEEDDADKANVYREQAALFEQELGDVTRAFMAYRDAFLLEPEDDSLLHELERLAAMVDAWDSLRGVIESVLQSHSELDSGVQRDLNMRAASWYRDHMADFSAAEACLRSALEADGETMEAHEALVSLLRAPERERDLIPALIAWSKVDFDEEANKSRYHEAADLALDTQNDVKTAAGCYREILELDPTDVSALDKLIEIHRLKEEFEEVAELLVRRIDAEDDPQMRMTLRKQLAHTYGGSLRRVREAVEAWQGALDDDPTDLECIDALEKIFQAEGRFDELEDLLQRRLDLAESSEDRIAVRVRLVRLVEGQGRRDDAMTQLREILDDDPQNGEALSELERFLTLEESWDDLADLLERRVEDAEAEGNAAGVIEALTRLGSLQRERLDDIDRAIDTYRRVMEREPSHVAALEALVAMHESREEWDEVVDGLERLAHVNEHGAIATYHRAADIALERLEDAVRAEGLLREAFESDRTQREARERLKSFYRLQEAFEALADMIKLDLEEAADESAQVTILRELAELYQTGLEKPTEAIDALERASSLVPEDREVLLPLCDLYVQSGRESEAIPVLERIIASYGTRRNKEVAVYHHRVGQAKESMGDLDAAIAAYDAAFKIDLTNILVLRDLGRLCLERNELERAQKTFRALLLQRLTPDSGISKADVYYRLGEISLKQGDERKAVSMLERAKSEDKEHAQALALLAQLKG